jgi:hypothetical protein
VCRGKVAGGARDRHRRGDARAARRDGPAALDHPTPHAGAHDVERAPPRAVSAGRRGADLGGPRPPWRALCPPAAGGVCAGRGHRPLAAARGGCGGDRHPTGTQARVPRSVDPAVSRACATPWSAGRSGLGVVRADQGGGLGPLPCPAGARARGHAGRTGLADRWRPAGSGASRKRSRRCSTAGLPGHDPTAVHGPIRACTHRGRRVSHPSGVGPGQRREAVALAPREAHPGHPQGPAVGLAGPVVAPPHPPVPAGSGARRGLSRRLRSG